MIVIEIENKVVNVRSGGTGADPWVVHEQQIVIHGLHKNGFEARYPSESVVRLDSRNPVPFEPGKYVIRADSFRIGRFDRFEMAYLNLQPLASFLAEVQEVFGVKKAA